MLARRVTAIDGSYKTSPMDGLRRVAVDKAVPPDDSDHRNKS